MEKDARPLIAVYVVTYRRPHLLERALRSVIAQTEQQWVCRVVNDDPLDGRVEVMLEKLKDGRISLFKPIKHRGGAGNFNLAFAEKECDFASILEDDNWWEPDFLAFMLASLHTHPHCEIACGNERIWREQPDGTWQDTGVTVWLETDEFSEWKTSFEAACGSAKLCNSSLVFRTAQASSWQTPDDIPVDVTEHFRERCVSQPILLVHRPLVNYAETVETHRSVKGSLWGSYQSMLIGSCFYSLEPGRRVKFAQDLWKKAGRNPSPRASSLLMAALCFSEARCLWQTSSLSQRARFLVTMVRRMPDLWTVLRAPRRLGPHWNFLCNCPYNRKLKSDSSTFGSS